MKRSCTEYRELLGNPHQSRDRQVGAAEARAAKYLSKQLDKNRIAVLGVQLHHLARLEDLPPLHRDPFDRMIAAQAIAEKMPVLTVDEQLGRTGCRSFDSWAGAGTAAGGMVEAGG